LLFLSASFVPWKVQIAMDSADETPPIGEKNWGGRDNMRAEIQKNSAPQHVHPTNSVDHSNLAERRPYFYTTNPATTFDFGFSR
jgi:hypothetical protein